MSKNMGNFYDGIELYLAWYKSLPTDRPPPTSNILGRMYKREADANNEPPKAAVPIDMRAAMRFEAALSNCKFNVRRYIVETHVYQMTSKINVSERELRNAMTYIAAVTFSQSSIRVAA